MNNENTNSTELLLKALQELQQAHEASKLACEQLQAVSVQQLQASEQLQKQFDAFLAQQSQERTQLIQKLNSILDKFEQGSPRIWPISWPGYANWRRPTR